MTSRFSLTQVGRHAAAIALTGVFLLVGTTAALAHGSSDHIMGTVTAVTDTAIDLTTKAGKKMTVKVDDKTAFEARGKSTAGKKPQAGDRVVIDVAGKGADQTASHVVFSTPPKGKATK
ncbi:MAG: hypothetical protein U0172_08410 [Nitrospiraceae bacterium]